MYKEDAPSYLEIWLIQELRRRIQGIHLTRERGGRDETRRVIRKEEGRRCCSEEGVSSIATRKTGNGKQSDKERQRKRKDSRGKLVPVHSILVVTESREEALKKLVQRRRGKKKVARLGASSISFSSSSTLLFCKWYLDSRSFL